MEFLFTDVRALRRTILADIAERPYRPESDVDTSILTGVLNGLRATELVNVARYRAHFSIAESMNAGHASLAFLSHADEVAGNATLIAARIMELGGEPNTAVPSETPRPPSTHNAFELLEAMVCEDLSEEHVVIDTYRAVITWLGDDSSAQRDLLEIMASKAQKRADVMRELLIQVNYPPIPRLDAVDGVGERAAVTSADEVELSSTQLEGRRVRSMSESRTLDCAR